MNSNPGGLTNHELASEKIAALKVGDELTYQPPTIGEKILRDKIIDIFRDADGERVFDVGERKFLVPAHRILLPDWS